MFSLKEITHVDEWYHFGNYRANSVHDAEYHSQCGCMQA